MSAVGKDCLLKLLTLTAGLGDALRRIDGPGNADCGAAATGPSAGLSNDSKGGVLHPASMHLKHQCHANTVANGPSRSTITCTLHKTHVIEHAFGNRPNAFYKLLLLPKTLQLDQVATDKAFDAGPEMQRPALRNCKTPSKRQTSGHAS